MAVLVVYKNVSNIVGLELGWDVSSFSPSDFISQVRVNKDDDSDLILDWTVAFETGGETEGKLTLSYNDTGDLDDYYVIIDDKTGVITKADSSDSPGAEPLTVGYMDVKYLESGQLNLAFDDRIKVQFRETVTMQ